MSSSVRHPRLAIIVAVALASLTSGPLAMPPVDAAEPGLRLPDLRMARPQDIQLERVRSGPLAGHRLLRFTTIVVNEGTGPIDVVGNRSCRSITRCPTMRVRQRILRSDGSWLVRRTTARLKYEVGDHHHHWHVVGYEGYQLFRLGVWESTPRVGAKFGFCFFDIARVRPFGPPVRRYPESFCGTPDSLRVHVGLSEGWQDTYPSFFAGQYIDITGIAAGDYLLCVTADPAKLFRQSDTTNDQAWVRVHIGRRGIAIRDWSRGSCSYERKRWVSAPTA
jgi:Lysyl oxidase